MKIYSDNIAQKSDMEANAKTNAKSIDQINHHIAELNMAIEQQDAKLTSLQDRLKLQAKYHVLTGVISFLTGSGGGYALIRLFS